MQLDVIAVTWGQTHELGVLINSMLCQTADNWRLWLVHDGPGTDTRDWCEQHQLLSDPRVKWRDTIKRMNDHGHSSRAWAIRNVLTGTHVVLTNGDNYYMPCWVQQISRLADQDMITWDCVHNYDTPANHNNSSYGWMRTMPRLGHMDMGVAAVRTSLARQVGFKDRHVAADWSYFKRVLATNPTRTHVDKIMMVHN